MATIIKISQTASKKYKKDYMMLRFCVKIKNKSIYDLNLDFNHTKSQLIELIEKLNIPGASAVKSNGSSFRDNYEMDKDKKFVREGYLMEEILFLDAPINMEAIQTIKTEISLTPSLSNHIEFFANYYIKNTNAADSELISEAFTLAKEKASLIGRIVDSCTTPLCVEISLNSFFMAPDNDSENNMIMKSKVSYNSSQIEATPGEVVISRTIDTKWEI